jgi:signal transduction histidine kinase
VTGHGLYTTIDALGHYLEFAFSSHQRVVLIVDYLQEVPVISTERRLEPEERIEQVLAGLKSLALRYTNEGSVLAVIAVAAADAEGLRKGRIHLENLWGNATIQYKPDVAWIGNRERGSADGIPVVRWAVEKNRRGPSELEFRHRYHGAAYSFEREGAPVGREESWQAERVAPGQPRPALESDAPADI